MWKAKKLGLLVSLILISIQSFAIQTFAGRDEFKRMAPDQANEPSPMSQVDKDVLSLFLNRMKLSEQLEARRISREFDYRVTQKWNFLKSEAFKNLEAKFVSIPAGLLPDGTEIDAFDTISAVDRQTWEAFMGGPTQEFPKKGKGNWIWANCPTCPVTHVAWEEVKEHGNKAAEIQKFIARYNAEAKKHPELIPPGKTECFYRAGTQGHRQYANLGDPTGNDHKFMLGEGGVEVTEANANDYFWYSGNSNTDETETQIQPLGTKKKNAYRLERPSVFILTETVANQDLRLRNWYRPTFGGSWRSLLEYAHSYTSAFETLGSRSKYTGFSVVRICN